jgi:hypothetical protein
MGLSAWFHRRTTVLLQGANELDCKERLTEQAANKTANTNVKPLIFNKSAEAIGDFAISTCSTSPLVEIYMWA